MASPTSAACAPEVPQPLHVRTVSNAALAHEHGIGGSFRREGPGHGEVRLERSQVAVVDADDLRSGLRRGRHLGLVVDLHQALKSYVPRSVQHLPQLLCRQHRDDEQRRVRARGTGLVELVGVRQEVFAQRRYDRYAATASFTCRKCSNVPSKWASVRHEMAAAPLAAYVDASHAGSKSARSSPADGDAFFTSAMRRMSLAPQRRRKVDGGRGVGDPALQLGKGRLGHRLLQRRPLRLNDLFQGWLPSCARTPLR